MFFFIYEVKSCSNWCHDCPAHALGESNYDLQLIGEIEVHAICLSFQLKLFISFLLLQQLVS